MNRFKTIFIYFCLAIFVFSGLPSADAKDKDKETKKELKAPEFPKKMVWLNTKRPLKSDFFNKRLTMIYFWDYSSANSLREIQLIKSWYEQYRGYGFEMIWVHSPEFKFAHEKGNVEKALKRLDIPFFVVLDNDYKIWEAYKVKSWPTKFLVNSNKEIVHSQIGEGRYVELEDKIRENLLILNSTTVLPPKIFDVEPEKFLFEECGDMTAETYMGYKRAGWWGGRIANKQWAAPDQTTVFKDRGERVQRGFFLEGKWTNNEDNMLYAGSSDKEEDYLGLVYLGFEVYSVIANLGKEKFPKVYITRDGEPVPPGYRGLDVREDELGETYFTISDSKLYYLITNDSQELHEIKIWPQSDGVAVHSFSFANRCLSDFEHL